ncbi:MAG: hypothetical protein ACOYNC_04550 [Bacteroidales bacterium]
MKRIEEVNNRKHKVQNTTGSGDIAGYPSYPPDEDVYNKFREERDINPEDISKDKDPNDDELSGITNVKGFAKNLSGNDLDIPGSELDDIQEDIGSEDEENNFYSLGGDGHTTLDEENG